MSRDFDVVGQLDGLRRYARALTRDDAQADDLVQDVLVRAYERRGQFHPSRNLKLWLMSVVHNTFVDGLRRRRAEALRLTDGRSEPEVTPDAPQESALRLAQVTQAFAALPEEQRSALHLVAVEGLPYQEAAAALGIPLGTLMSRIARGRAALRAFEDGAAPERQAPLSPSRLRIVGGTDGLDA